MLYWITDNNTYNVRTVKKLRYFHKVQCICRFYHAVAPIAGTIHDMKSRMSHDTCVYNF